MNQKLFLSDLIQAFATKQKISLRQSEAFIKAFFEVIATTLEREQLVKIKGCGTFKTISIEERESVNIQTGERFIIESHPRITFIPDATMKNLINRPFAHFQTIILNDEVSDEQLQKADEASDQWLAAHTPSVEENNLKETLDNEDTLGGNAAQLAAQAKDINNSLTDLSEIEESEETEEEKEEDIHLGMPNEQPLDLDIVPETAIETEHLSDDLPEAPIEESLPDALPSPAQPETMPTEAHLERLKQEEQEAEEEAQKLEDFPELAKEYHNEEAHSEETTEEEEEETYPYNSEETMQESTPKNLRKWQIATFILAIICIFLLGYIFGRSIQAPGILERSDEQVIRAEPAEEDVLKNDSDTIMTAPEANAPASESKAPEAKAATAAPEVVKKVETTAAAPQVQAPAAAAPSAPASLPKEPTGPVSVKGTLTTHTLVKGDNLYYLAARYYGSKAYAKYIIAYNNIANPDNISLGSTIKIPKLVVGK